MLRSGPQAIVPSSRVLEKNMEEFRFLIAFHLIAGKNRQ